MAKLIKMGPDSAVLMIEVQIDFTRKEGSFEIDGAKVIPVINKIAAKAPCVIATIDWHPENHCSFKKNGGLWPKHCVPGTKGAELDPDLNIRADVVLGKGVNPEDDFYDSFDIRDLEPILRARGIKKVFVVGFIIEVCAGMTAKSAAKLGFETYLIADACGCIKPDELDKTIADLEAADVKVIESKDIDLK